MIANIDIGTSGGGGGSAPDEQSRGSTDSGRSTNRNTWNGSGFDQLSINTIGYRYVP